LNKNWIDIHCHLLPGRDDGCQDLGATFECIRSLRAAGFAGSICTPHFIPRLYPDNVPERIAAAVAETGAALAEAGLEYRLWAGAEVRLDPATLGWFRDFGVPTLAGSKHVLIDYFGSEWPAFADSTIDWLLESGYAPILAHPERMALSDERFEALIPDLAQRGVRLQGNANCFTGREGAVAAGRAARLLDAGAYAHLALDLHGPAGLASRLEGLGEAQLLTDKARLDELLGEAPGRIVSG
jgi:protein-tyrosine phosphatase